MSKNAIQKIVQMIDDNHGKISFYDYMQSVLYDPIEGYYSAHIPPIGKPGDFITAPELSPLFGYCVARSILSIIKKFNHSTVVELGGGTGSLAYAILEYFSQNNIVLSQYIIVDISEPLKKIQKETLKKFSHQIKWVNSLNEIENISGVVIANEFFDALPVRKFCYQRDENNEKNLWEYFVKKSENENLETVFDWRLEKANKNMQNDLSFLRKLELPEIYHHEYHPDIPQYFQMISKCLNAGAVLILDYGYSRSELYHSQRNKGTMRCYYQHRLNDNPFLHPGFQDMTAHVDFTAIAESAHHVGFELLGFTTQAAFLLSLGIIEMCKSHEDNQAVKLLTLPQEMGELIKVMLLSKNTEISPSGFELADQKYKL